MPLKLYCPTKFEIPGSYRPQTEIFGMGIRRGQALAEKLNQTEIESQVIVFGSAGALDPKLKPGDFFLIDEIHFENKNYNLNTPTLELPKAKLFTSDRLLKTKNEKALAYTQSGASLVDMEMGAIWKYSNETTRKNLIFIRTVIDHAEQDFPNLKSLNAFKNMYSLVKNWRIYLQGTENALLKFLPGT